MGKFQKLCRAWMPPIIYEYLKFILKKRSISGCYINWAEASNHSIGYDSKEIVSKVLKTTLNAIQVGGYERDGVHFLLNEYSWPVVCGVLLGATGKSENFHVLDFGGALGGLYLQHKKILDSIPNLKWGIIEQQCFVDAAKQNIKIKNLDFYYSASEYLEYAEPNVIIFSSSLQYLENPEQILSELVKTDAKYLVIDRTPFHPGIDHRIKVQLVSKSIYNASYPIRIFSKQALMVGLTDTWNLLASGPSPEGVVLADDGSEISFEWLIMERVSV